MKRLHVAAGVIRGANGHVLIAKRSMDKHQGGLWEFPGGKVELGESLSVALARELYEELAISVGRTTPLLEIRHDYGDKLVWLDVHVVWQFSGTPCALEGQPMKWVAPAELAGYAIPEANRPIIAAIEKLLPDA